MADTEVVIYYGPPSWFHERVGEAKTKNFVELMMKSDEERRQLTVHVPGADVEPEPKPKRPRRVVVESSDFASLNEHVITNFAQHVRNVNPKQLLVNNPPSQVHEQIDRAYKKTTKVDRYTYPTFTIDTLLRFRNGFADHLIGQHRVKEIVLAAMYPLAQPRRTRPVVLMLYGPSGVGKTQTAQFINSLLGGSLLRKQFSMYHSEKFTSYLFGGSHSEPSLAHDLLDRESGVILIDEFDKANPVFHSAFYELFDTGEFVDKNYSVNLGPCLIICTSNYESEDDVRHALGDALFSRFDALIEFEPLSAAETLQVIERIVDDRLTNMTEGERTHIDREDLLARLHVLADNSSNVRTLGKTIETTMSILLVRAALDTSTAPTPSRDLNGAHRAAEDQADLRPEGGAPLG